MRRLLFKQSMAWVAVLCAMGCCLSCGRKDVDRHGDIKLRGERPVSLKSKRPGDFLQKGMASWYGEPFHGRKTASGETYDMWRRTAAHKTLPINTLVKVENRDNGRSTVVRINDRGPFVKGRIIDLSRRAAEDLGMIGSGTARVTLYLAGERAMNRWAKKHRSPDRAATDAKHADSSTATEHQKNRGFWTIQVGAFSEFQRARAMVYRLEEFAQRVMIEKSDGLYRVRIGVFETRDETSKLCDSLSAHDIPCWVTYADSVP